MNHDFGVYHALNHTKYEIGFYLELDQVTQPGLIKTLNLFYFSTLNTIEMCCNGLFASSICHYHKLSERAQRSQQQKDRTVQRSRLWEEQNSCKSSRKSKLQRSKLQEERNSCKGRIAPRANCRRSGK